MEKNVRLLHVIHGMSSKLATLYKTLFNFGNIEIFELLINLRYFAKIMIRKPQIGTLKCHYDENSFSFTAIFCYRIAHWGLKYSSMLKNC